MDTITNWLDIRNFANSLNEDQLKEPVLLDVIIMQTVQIETASSEGAVNLNN